MDNPQVKVHVDQLGDVMVSTAIATIIWIRSSKEYASGLFSTHVILNDKLTVHRFIDEHTFDLLAGLQSMGEYYNRVGEEERAREQEEQDHLQSKADDHTFGY